MLLSFALILLLGGVAGRLFGHLKLPPLLGMLLVGIVMSPSVLNLLDPMTLDISGILRQIALIIILTRAGLSLSLRDLKKVGRPAIFMSFVPAIFEIVGIGLLAPLLLGVSPLEALLMGSVLAAVSPAVVVPHMLKIKEKGYGVNKGIPQLILAGASIDDVFVIVIFSALLGIMQGVSISWVTFGWIPVRILLGIAVGLFVGNLLAKLFERVRLNADERTLTLIAVSFILVTIENETTLPFSGLLAVMFAGIMIQRKNVEIATQLTHHYNHFWSAASIALFVLVGASVNVNFLFQAGVAALAVIFGGLSFRIVGVFVSLLGTNLNWKERLFCMIAYSPKATVQASIGGLPLAAGLASGNIILVVAVLAIMTTAPLGAFLIDHTYKRLLAI